MNKVWKKAIKEKVRRDLAIEITGNFSIIIAKNNKSKMHFGEER